MNRKPPHEPVIGFREDRARAMVLAGSITTLTVLFVGCIAVILLNLPSQDLGRLSDAGQAFGIVSALLSGAAFAGVAASVAYQSRQNRQYRLEIWHTAHANLLFRVLDDPATFGPCIGDPARFDSEEEMRRFYFTTLWLNFGQIGYRSGNFTEKSIRDEMCADMFASPIARDLWVKRCAMNVDRYGGLSSFHEMVEEEFRTVTLQTLLDIQDPSEKGAGSLPGRASDAGS